MLASQSKLFVGTRFKYSFLAAAHISEYKGLLLNISFSREVNSILVSGVSHIGGTLTGILIFMHCFISLNIIV